MKTKLKIGDVVLTIQGGYGFVSDDIGKYVEVVGFDQYFDGEGVRIIPYDKELVTEEPGINNVVGLESFGVCPVVKLNTLENDNIEQWDNRELGADEEYVAVSPPEMEEAVQSALNKQVSGSHYKDCAIQPIEYIHANNLNYFEGNAIKYITRHKGKNKEQDILKAIHYLELILELQYGYVGNK